MDKIKEVNYFEEKKLFKANEFYKLMNKRRSVRHFLNKEVPLELIKECIKTAGTSPSGANKQPWFFSIIRDTKLKQKIRIAAEKEEYEFYNSRADTKFLNDLTPFDVSWKKSHLEDASTLIVIFSKSYEQDKNDKNRCYYPKESVGIATGILITALHKLGISTLTHTPCPMSFLTRILERPKGEKPFLILATGYKAASYQAPSITRKTLDEICEVYE